MAVKQSITAMAIRADKAKSYCLVTHFTAKMAITKLVKSTISGFMLSSFDSVTKLVNALRPDNEPRLSNSLANSAQRLWGNSNVRGNVFEGNLFQ